MKYKNKFIILLVAVLLLTGCTTTLKTEDKKVVKNPETGQSLTANILCKPTRRQLRWHRAAPPPRRGQCCRCGQPAGDRASRGFR